MLVCYFSSAGKLEPELALIMTFGQVGRSGSDAASRLGLAQLETYVRESGECACGGTPGQGDGSSQAERKAEISSGLQTDYVCSWNSWILDIL